MRVGRFVFLRLLRVHIAGVQFIGRNAKPRQRANMGKCGRFTGITTAARRHTCNGVAMLSGVRLAARTRKRFIFATQKRNQTTK